MRSIATWKRDLTGHRIFGQRAKRDAHATAHTVRVERPRRRCDVQGRVASRSLKCPRAASPRQRFAVGDGIDPFFPRRGKPSDISQWLVLGERTHERDRQGRQAAGNAVSDDSSGPRLQRVYLRRLQSICLRMKVGMSMSVSSGSARWVGAEGGITRRGAPSASGTMVRACMVGRTGFRWVIGITVRATDVVVWEDARTAAAVNPPSI